MNMKKSIAVFVFAALLSTAAFGADFFSFGVGLRMGPLLHHRTPPNELYNIDSKGTDEMRTEEFFNGSGFLGFDVFFDAKYVEADIGLYFEPTPNETKMMGGLETSLHLGLLVKIPFTVNDRFTVFPLLGAGYKFMLAMSSSWGDTQGRDGTEDKTIGMWGPNNRPVTEEITTGARYDELWFKAGIGGDIALSDRVYIRNELLWGFRLNNPYDEYSITVRKMQFKETTYFHHGVTYKLAVGFKLGKAAAPAQTAAPVAEPATTSVTEPASAAEPASVTEPASQTPATGYYLNINDQRYGPYDMATMELMVPTRQLTAETLAWKEGMADWAAAGTVPELQALF